MRCLALASLALALPAIVFAVSAFYRGGQHYLSGTIAATLIGAILLGAAFCAWKGARHSPTDPSIVLPRWRRGIVGCLAVPVGLILALSGFGLLFDAWRYLNQEYLRLWSPKGSFEPDNPHTFLLSSYIVGTLLWISGLVLTGLGFGQIVKSLRRRPSDSSEDH